MNGTLPRRANPTGNSATALMMVVRASKRTTWKSIPTKTAGPPYSITSSSSQASFPAPLASCRRAQQTVLPTIHRASQQHTLITPDPLIGQSTNLAPFSYTSLINHDPPLLTIGFAGGLSNAKDTLTNLLSTKECTVNIISEHYIEAANACSINAPYGISEWSLSGLTPAPSSLVKPSRVKEAVFSIEGKVFSHQEFESRVTKGKKTGVLVVVEGVKFWVREDAINEERNIIDPGVLRPVSRLGGIMYGRTTEGVEIPRPDFKEKEKVGETEGLVKPKVEGQ